MVASLKEDVHLDKVINFIYLYIHLHYGLSMMSQGKTPTDSVGVFHTKGVN